MSRYSKEMNYRDVIFDEKFLKEEIKKNGGVSKIANELGIGQGSLSDKINQKRPFTRQEMIKIKELLKLDDHDFIQCFFEIID